MEQIEIILRTTTPSGKVTEQLLAKFDTIGKQRASDKTQAASQTIRNYGIGAQILRDIGAGKIRLLGHPKKMPSMAGFNLDIVGYRDNKDL